MVVAPTTVTYSLDTPAGGVRAGVSVSAVLVGAGDRNDSVGVVGGPVTVLTDDTGTFTLSLLPNSVYEQLATYYAVNVTGGPAYSIVVPVSDTPVDLWDLRVDPRTLTPVAAEVAPMYLLRTERAAANGVASLGANGKVPSAQLPASSGGDAVTSVNSQLPDVDGNVTLTAAQVGADASGTAAAAVAAHTAALDPHSQYLTSTEGGALYDALGAATAAVTAHTGATDPHSQYLTAAEGSAAYDALGAAAAAVAAHVAAGDPHTQYLTSAEGNAAYLQLSQADTKGDLFVATGDNTIVKLPVGSNTQVLTADSAQASGVKWAAAAAGSSGENDVYGPIASGFGEWTCDPLLLTTNFATASGLLVLVRHKFRAAMTIDEIGFCLQQAGVTPGAYSGVAVYADGTGSVAKQGESADAGSSFTSTGLKSIALASGVAVSAGDCRWIGYLWQGSSPPRLYAPPGPADQVALNVGRRRSVFLSGQTAFPSSVDVSAATANTTTYWFSFKDV